MTKIVLGLFAIVISGLLLFSQTGCLIAAVAAGTGGTIAYMNGDLETTLPADSPAVVNAAEKALKTLDIAVISRESTQVAGKVIGRTAGDKKVTIDVKRQADKITKVWIRSGFFGNDSTQGNVLIEMKKQLGIDPASN